MRKRKYVETEYTIPKEPDLGTEYHQSELVEEAALTGKLKPSRTAGSLYAKRRENGLKMLAAVFSLIVIAGTGLAIAIPAETAEPVSEEVESANSQEIVSEIPTMPIDEYVEEGDDSFPVLSDLSPDSEFASLWLYGEDGERYYLYDTVMLSEKEFYTEDDFKGYVGASYDVSTNTLTLNNCSFNGFIHAERMGNGFTIHLIGDNQMSSIDVSGQNLTYSHMGERPPYAASLGFTGDGTLEVGMNNPHSYAISLDCSGKDGCIMIGNQLTLDIRADAQLSAVAIITRNTSQEKGIYYLKPNAIQTEGTRRTKGDYSLEPGTPDDYYLGVNDDSVHVLISPMGKE